METKIPQPTSTITLVAERGPEGLWADPPQASDIPDSPIEPGALAVTRSILAAFARWFLVIALVMLAPVALIVWSVTPRVTNPSQIAAEAIDSGLTDAVRVALVDQLSTDLTEAEDSPFRSVELRAVVERNVSQDWFDEQLTLLAAEFDRWLDASSSELPNLTIDLTPVKSSLAADAQALPAITAAMGCNGPGCPSPELAMAELLSELPDEASLLNTGDESEVDPGGEILDARDQFQVATRFIAVVPMVLVAALVAMVLLARRGSRLRWLGATLITISVPVLTAATLLPRWASRQATGSVPDEIPLDRASLEEMFAWVVQPAGSTALWLLLAGVVAFVTSVTLGVHRRRTG